MSEITDGADELSIRNAQVVADHQIKQAVAARMYSDEERRRWCVEQGISMARIVVGNGTEFNVEAAAVRLEAYVRTGLFPIAEGDAA